MVASRREGEGWRDIQGVPTFAEFKEAEEEYRKEKLEKSKLYLLDHYGGIACAGAFGLIMAWFVLHPEVAKKALDIPIEIIKIPGEVLELGTPFQGGVF